MNALHSITGMRSPIERAARQHAAKLLSAHAPPEHQLAFINPREAELLRARGGSGVIDPDTGVQRFDDGSEFDFGGGTIGEGGGQPPPVVGGLTPDAGGGQFGGGGQSFGFGLNDNAGAAPSYGFGAPDFSGGGPSAPPPSTATGGQLTPGGGAQLGFGLDENTRAMPGYGITPPDFSGAGAQPGQPPAQPGGGLFKGLDLGKLAVAGVTGLLGAKGARNAQAQGQQAVTQTKQIAAPYQQTGQQLQAQAQRGELSPSGQQAIEAMRAQLKQGIEGRGGVGVAQAENQIAALRARLLDQQYQLGLQISGIGDKIALGAITTGIQADQYVNSLTNSYFTNMARTLYGTPPTPQTPGTP